jgi:hypothetical protein
LIGNADFIFKKIQTAYIPDDTHFEKNGKTRKEVTKK